MQTILPQGTVDYIHPDLKPAKVWEQTESLGKVTNAYEHVHLETMKQLLSFYFKAADYNVVDGYVLSVEPPSG